MANDKHLKIRCSKMFVELDNRTNVHSKFLLKLLSPDDTALHIIH